MLNQQADVLIRRLFLFGRTYPEGRNPKIRKFPIEYPVPDKKIIFLFPYNKFPEDFDYIAAIFSVIPR